MTEVGVETLKDQLGDYLRRAQQGERIVIMEGGRSVALLISFENDEVATRAWKLVESGAVHWSGGKPLGSEPRRRARGGMLASDVVLEDRR